MKCVKLMGAKKLGLSEMEMVTSKNGSVVFKVEAAGICGSDIHSWDGGVPEGLVLGHEFAGLFSNNDDLASKINTSAKDTGEKVWRMPLSEHYDSCIDSKIADIRNLGKAGTRAGGITAAQFLKRFVNHTPWAHIDIAGVEHDNDGIFLCNGATGFGVHLLYDFIVKNYVK